MRYKVPLKTAESLPRVLRRLAFLVESGKAHSRHVERLAADAERTLMRVDRDNALHGLSKLMPGTSRWAQAGAIADALRRFEGTGWPRIQNGYREPRSELERLCSRVLVFNATAPCQRSVWDALREGELLAEIEPKQGANQNIRTPNDTKVYTRTAAATEAGLLE